MKNEDLEKTQYMRPGDVEQVKSARRPSLSDTQELPPVDDELGIKPAFPQGRTGSNVRELSRDDREPEEAKAKPKKFLTAGRKKALCLMGGFAAALFIGFMIAGYSQNQSDKQQTRQVQEQQLKDKEQKLAGQEADLKARREQLEKQKKDLQEQQRQLEEQSSRAKGRNEQLGDSAPGSPLGKLVDKVTGKEAERQRQMEQNKQQSAESDTQAADVRKSIDEAQKMLDDVNAKLDSVAAMKQEASQLKERAAAAYEENKGTIDEAIRYAKIGAGMLEGLLSH
ncbi:hypothetical protein SAMN02910356_02398 [Selenomonas sp. GACV-9]|uniref:hypothetical protein n=1 Tax=Selenomonas sp. GACV-9 TaxID=3158782 RepID=UPI0008E3023A|nr:hypothetical protein SAMN02910356_02398 [Selenomonas ruminantium]